MWGRDPGAGGLLDPDSAHEQIARWREHVERMAGDTKAMSDRLNEARVSVTDRDGLVEVTVDYTGRLVDLKLRDRVRNVSPEVIARTIMQTIGVAAGQMADRARQIVVETMGSDSAAGREIAERVAQQLQMPDARADHAADHAAGHAAGGDDRTRGR
jgi:DNA-binding protein YbaB